MSEFTEEIIATLGTHHNIPKKYTKLLIEEVLDLICDTVLTKGDVRFGRHGFKQKYTPSRKCRNPRTGETFVAPAKVTVVYKNKNAVVKEDA
jgi:nucleoid DNA-binding protein